jgi:hypothetical protein
MLRITFFMFGFLLLSQAWAFVAGMGVGVGGEAWMSS